MHSVRAAKPSPTYSKTCNGMSIISYNKYQNFMKFDETTWHLHPTRLNQLQCHSRNIQCIQELVIVQ